MFFNKLLAVAAFTGCFFAAQAQQVFSVSSLSNTVQLKLIQNSKGALQYSVYCNGKTAVEPSELGIKLSKPVATLTNFTIISFDTTTVKDSWQPVWGEVKTIDNDYKQLHLVVKDAYQSDITMEITFRVFDDGVGFRYSFPKQKAIDHFVVADELTSFVMSGDHKTFWIPGDFDTNEMRYTTTKLSEAGDRTPIKNTIDVDDYGMLPGRSVQTPLMMKSTDGLYINIHEAALVDYPAMQLLIDRSDLSLHAQLVPDAVGNKAYLQAPFSTPWRTIVVSNKATDILASKLILNLNEPSNVPDPTWITPQKFAGVWWEMQIGKSTWAMEGGKHGATTANVKRYIDFAAKNHLDGVLVEGWDVGWEDWVGNWKENVFDFVTPYNDYDIDELTAYAKKKNVKIICHHETSGSATNYERWMDTAYRFMQNHNMDAVKTGYVGRIIPRGEHHDGQWMVNHYLRVAQKTAKYHIMVDMHEPVRPTGLHRTYPNWLACEAARGNEFNAFSIGNLPEHETILPFTRLMGGPMDYTPGIFRIKLNQFDPNKTQQVHTTLTKQLALYITMYSPLQMVADLPENYDAHKDAFQFIKDVAVDWDDTKILEAEPGDYITTARKAKGKNTWFIGGITDENARTSSIKLDFLDQGKKYTATIYRDADDADWQKNPEAYTIEKIDVDNTSSLTVKLAPGGGYAVSISRK